MSVHVMRMRNRGSHACIQRALFKRVFRSPHVFVRVRAVVMSRKIAGRERQRRFVKRERVHTAGLPVCKRTGFIRQSALDPQPGIVRVSFQRVVD